VRQPDGVRVDPWYGQNGDGNWARWHDSRRRRLMTHKYRGCIVVFLINKSVKPNEEQKVLMSGFDQEFTVNTSKRVFRDIWQYK
jgi:hypothetical protein